MKVTAEPSPPAAPPWKAQKRSCAQTAEGPASEGPRGFSYEASQRRTTTSRRSARRDCISAVNGRPAERRCTHVHPGVIRQAYFHGIDASELGT